VIYQLVGEIYDIEVIAVGRSIRELKRLRKVYGRGRWRSSKELHQSDFLMVRYIEANSIGMRRTALAEKKSKSNGSSPRKKGPAGAQYVVCVKNDDYPASLELRKIYQFMRDSAAARLGMLRVVDESGEDYLYPDDYFVTIRLTPAVERAPRSAS
jgi:hypothetical protein